MGYGRPEGTSTSTRGEDKGAGVDAGEGCACEWKWKWKLTRAEGPGEERGGTWARCLATSLNEVPLCLGRTPVRWLPVLF